MTREEYIGIKEELKKLALTIRSLKGLYKEVQRDHDWKKVSHTCVGREPAYIRYRQGHTFMSLVRGKTRAQVEWNYAEKKYIPWLEEGIYHMCVRYGYTPDLDPEGRVESVRVIEEKSVEGQEVREAGA